MKRTIIFLLLLVFEILMPMQLFSQSAASVTWPLTKDSSPLAPTGNVIGHAGTFGNLIVRNYFHGYCQKTALNVAGDWPAESSENSTRYLQFAVTPTVGNNIKVTSISFFIGWTGTSNHMFANTYYSINQAFSPRTRLNTGGVLTLNNKDSSLISYSMNVPVSDGQTFYFRIYPWDNKEVTGKNCGIANLVISGTTGLGSIEEQVENPLPMKGEQQEKSSSSVQSTSLSENSAMPFQMPEVQRPTFPDRRVSIVDYGAVADGCTMSTKAFNDAIQACAKQGGGQVLVPAGLWLTGPIRFESNINLHLETGAVIMFSKNREDFPLIPTPTPSSKNYACANPIYGYDLENIAITGDGVIDGSGEVWRPMKKEKYTFNQWNRTVASGGVVSPDGKTWWPSQQALDGAEYLKSLRKDKKTWTAQDFAGAKDFLRPNMVVFHSCKKVLLDGTTFRNSPKFCVNPVQCENLVIQNIKIQNAWSAQNGDGLDIGSSHNVIVRNCVVDAGDDAICLKPGSVDKRSGWTSACENINIADCIVYHGHGGFVIGSETYGGTRNISVCNCTFIGTDVGLRFKSSRTRGGLTENIYIDGIYMKDIATKAILFDTYYDEDKPSNGEERTIAPVTDRTPRFQKFYIKNIVCNGAEQAIFVQGLPEQCIKDIEFTNITISAKTGVSCIDAEGLQFKNVKILLEQGPVFDIDNSRNITIQHPSFSPGASLFMKVVGKESENIHLIEVDLKQVKHGIELEKNVRADAVKQE